MQPKFSQSDRPRQWQANSHNADARCAHLRALNCLQAGQKLAVLSSMAKRRVDAHPSLKLLWERIQRSAAGLKQHSCAIGATCKQLHLLSVANPHSQALLSNTDNIAHHICNASVSCFFARANLQGLESGLQLCDDGRLLWAGLGCSN